MRIPIAYALGQTARLPLPELEPLDLVEIGALHFEAPDLERFPALRLARAVLAAGGTAPALLSAANEVAVEAFLAGRLAFTALAAAAEAVLDAQPRQDVLGLDAILEADHQARERARAWIEEHES